MDAHYEKMAEMCGGKGFFCRTVTEIQSAVKEALEVIYGILYCNIFRKSLIYIRAFNSSFPIMGSWFHIRGW